MSEHERHPATTDAWEWLEKGEGQDRSPENRESIRKALEELDDIFLRRWPQPKDEPKPLHEDYWETAQ